MLRGSQETGEISDALSPAALAGFLLAGFEGALLISKVNKSPEPLTNFLNLFFDTLVKPLELIGNGKE